MISKISRVLFSGTGARDARIRPGFAGTRKAVALPALCLCLGAAALSADPGEPIPTANRNPLNGLAGVPDAAGSGVLAPGETALRFSSEIASISIYDLARDREAPSLVLDGETQRYTLAWGKGLAGGWESLVVVPVLRHDGGFLDPLIEGWHDLFGLPNGDRDLAARGLLAYRYAFRGDAVDLRDSVLGIGDLRLGLARRLGPHFALRAQLKLPTGDADDLTGTGSTDLSASVHYSSSTPAAGVYTHLSLGVVVASEGDLLPQARENAVAFGSATLGWRVAQRWHLKAQLDGQSAAFDSPSAAIGDPSLQLSLSAATALSDRWSLELGFSEDIVVERSPDIVFFTNLRWHSLRGD